MTQQHKRRIREDGFTVFRGILPAPLVHCLRAACVPARELARAKMGPDVQRLQPILCEGINQRPFIEYAALPVLQSATAVSLRTLPLCGNFSHPNCHPTIVKVLRWAGSLPLDQIPGLPEALTYRERQPYDPTAGALGIVHTACGAYRRHGVL